MSASEIVKKNLWTREVIVSFEWASGVVEYLRHSVSGTKTLVVTMVTESSNIVTMVYKCHNILTMVSEI